MRRVTVQDVTALAFDALEVGDSGLRQRCEDALGGDRVAWREVAARVRRDAKLTNIEAALQWLRLQDVEYRWASDGPIGEVITAGEWLDDNREVSLVAALDLLYSGEHRGGGGAAPEYSVRLVPIGPMPEVEEEAAGCGHAHHHWDDACAYDGAEDA